MGDRVNKLIIGVNNLIRGRRRKKPIPHDKVLVLFSHCLQYSKCPQKIVNDLAECKRCGKCVVKDILEISERYGVKCAVASGGEMALQKVYSSDVSTTIAIACEKELSGGIKSIFPKRILALPNTRPYGPCKDCCVDTTGVEKLLKRILYCT
ncbi:MAG: DUF116 domain-containing protein [Planctomycetota bacterium]|nr:DUF116 domain-containing protein [Planctomycetota bacterium]MDI6787017.1 DUF116 domain-containing protein [Planctomycetota bacterium]